MYYSGREKELAKVKCAFSQNNSPAQKSFVIFGLGGSGKTEFAIKFAEDARQDLLWVKLHPAVKQLRSSAKTTRPRCTTTSYTLGLLHLTTYRVVPL
jgi:hypothetical protein